MTGVFTGLTVLDETECWDLLGREEVGRLAVAFHEQPDIFPVNYVADEQAIFFKTAEGTKLLSMVVGPTVAFEIDGIDEDTGDAWSVVVKGVAQEVPMFDRLDDSVKAYPWSAWPKSRVIRIAPETISGRRFHVVQHRPDPMGE